MIQATDEELYSNLAKDATAAFRTLYDRHSGPLLRFIYRFTVNQESAEEILHDIFTELLAKKFQPGPGSSLKSWLYSVAKNKSLNFIKKSSYEIKNESLMHSTSDHSDLEFKLIGENLLSKLSFAEAGLPLDLQKTWQLKKQGYDHQQIADALAIPIGTVKSRFHRLVEHLKKEFKNEL